MTRALISATEAKSAALQDMDIRSSYSSPVNQATGTGTDNIIVVEGAGQEIDNAGGHSKMGELIARSVYEAVKEAVYKQNGISTQRDVFQRLMERKISVPGLVSLTHCDCGIKKGDLSKALEEIILQPEYASFITSSLALSDDYEKGLVKDLKSYRLWCAAIAEELAQEDIDEMEELVDSDGMPVIIRMSLNAILNGIVQRARQGGRE
jgi:iron complex transport system substrate-binding protein